MGASVVPPLPAGAIIPSAHEPAKGENAVGKADDVIKKIAAAMNGHDAEALSALYAEDAVAYDPFYPQPLRGRKAIEEDAANFFRGFSDVRMDVMKVTEKDDRNASGELRLKGTHDGPMATPSGDMPATNKRVDQAGVVSVKLNERGEIAEERREYDPAEMMKQLGITLPQSSERGRA